ncbi:MAG: S-methyl-5'-thioinosine phosphorylase [Gammaproteobacteria bacterium]|nr:S-methyl-5'-thioinosine phosphorylase [Gammaproteobacteria bacterium]MYL00896.1 S-methyl-5'-thioinosine phosphorylase [Gammaproteobacteria bacterium]
MAIDGLAVISGAPAERLGMGPPESPAPTEDQPYGPPSAPVEIRRLNRVPVLYLNRHGADYAIAPHRINYRANLKALAEAGARRILGVHSVGGIAAEAVPGTIVIPHDLIDYTHSRETSFAQDGAGKSAFVEFANPFDADMRRGLVAAAEGTDCIVRGVYGVMQGPRLETAAEIDRLEQDGCTLVGMTLMPEAVLARELGIPYVSLSLVTNHAAGRNRQGETAGIIEQHAAWLDTGLKRAAELLLHWLASPVAHPP